jgi:hypothetical protein
MMRDYHHAMRLPAASSRDITSIKNWVNGTGGIARTETDFLSYPNDIANLTGALDSAVTTIEILIERALFRLSVPIRKNLSFLPEALKPGRADLTQDPNIFFAGPRLRSFSRAVTSCVAAGILLAPVVVLFCIQDALWRLITITVAVLFFLSALSTWTKARTIEVVTAGARYVPCVVACFGYLEILMFLETISYAAVLVVFTSASNALRPEHTSRVMG